jgi:hypothetical protein
MAKLIALRDRMCVCGYMVIQNQLKYLHLISVKRPVFCVLSDGHRERELKAVRPHCGPGQEMLLLV